MARTTLTKTTLQGPFVALQPAADSLDVTFAVADVANKNQFAASGNDVIIAWNTGASAYTITITSVADAQLRTGDITTYSIGASEIAVFKVGNDGWRQTDGKVY